jgi:hypothetical protein
VTFGFSKRNAEIAIQMLQNGQLDIMEEKVIEKLKLAPNDMQQPKVEYYIPTCSTGIGILEHLNYKITQNGGDAVIKANKRRV